MVNFVEVFMNIQLLFIFLYLLPRCLVPKMKGVGENDITHNSFRMIIGEVNRGINLKIRGDVPSESNSR